MSFHPIFCQISNRPRRNESIHKFNSITTQSIARYANTLCRLLFSVLRSISATWNKSVRYPKLSESQRIKFQTLSKELSGGSDKAIDAAFHEACYAVFAHERQPDKSMKSNWKFFSPVNSFAVYASVRQDGSFEKASRITQTLAMLMYAARATMLFESKKISDERVISIFECAPFPVESL